jgi:broad specificity phosphatase PhoE
VAVERKTTLMLQQVFLVRHGETEWSIAGRHTSRSDLPLTPKGEAEARELGPVLAKLDVSFVLCSPRRRAIRTCELAGFRERVEITEAIAEWDYGDVEGLTGIEVRTKLPHWNLFRDGAPRGETPEQISARADLVVSRIRGVSGNALLFSHGHFLRAFAARWVGWPVHYAQPLLLSPASLSILGFEHDNLEEPAIRQWNYRG